MTSRLVSLLAFALFVAGLAVTWPFVADDAYIVGRYALNAAAGEGLLYNAGERINALTSPLHGLIEVAFAWISPDPVALWRGVALVLPPAGVFAALAILRPAPEERALVLAFALASPFLALWTRGGLETPLLFAIVTVFAAIAIRAFRQGEISDAALLAAGLLAGLAFLTRHDSVLVTLPPMLAAAVVLRRRRALWLAAALAAALPLLWLGWATAYFGDPLPVSAYRKLGNSSARTAANVGTTINAFLLTGAVLLALAAGLARGGPRRAPRPALSRALALGAVLSLALFTAYGLKAAGAHMMFGFRAFVPYLGALGLLAAAATGARALPVASLLLALHAGTLTLVATRGINPAVVTSIGPLGSYWPEYSIMTPASYGRTIDSLEADAAAIRAHWQATGETGTPAIRLYTGGMGYWLRDFYVYEILVSYRHECPNLWRDKLAGSTYRQSMISLNRFERRARAFAETRAEGVEVETLDLAPHPGRDTWGIAYHYGRPADARNVLPDRIGGTCPVDLPPVSGSDLVAASGA